MAGLVDGDLGDAGHGWRPHACHGCQPGDRSGDRRPQPAHGGTASTPGHPAPWRTAGAGIGRGRVDVYLGVDAEPALPRPGPGGPRVSRGLFVHEALHLDLALDPRVHRRHRRGGRLDRGARALRSAGPAPVVRGHRVDRRLRSHLCVPGRGGRPGPAPALGARALWHRPGPDPGAPQPCAHRGGPGCCRVDGGARPPVLGGLAGRRGPLRLRALAGDAARSLEDQHRFLQRERLHRGDHARRRGHRSLAVTGAPPTPSPPQARPPGSKALLVSAMFTRIAGRYDLMNSLMTGGRHHAWRRLVARAVAAAPAGPVLDLATGTGDLALAIRETDRRRTVVGADFAAGMLAQARTKLRERAERRIPLAAADALALPFRDRAFAAVTSAFLLRNLDGLEAGLREMRRVTQPGGLVVTLDIVRPGVPVWGALFGLYFHRVVPAIGAMVAGDRNAYTYLP